MNIRKILLISGVIMVFLTGCVSRIEDNGNSVTSQLEELGEIDDFYTRRFQDVGMQFTIPKNLKAKADRIDAYAMEPIENVKGQMVVSLITTEIMDKAKELNEKASEIPETETEKIKQASQEIIALMDDFQEVFRVVSIDTKGEDGKVKEDLFAKYDKKDLIGKEGDLEFYMLYDEKPEPSGLSDKSLEEYLQVHGEMEEFKKGIKVFKPITEQEILGQNTKFEFDTVTLDGTKISSEIFKENKLTMVNVWATYCTPCIAEMPDLELLYKDLKKDGLNLIGVVSDTPDEDNEMLAKSIIEKKGVSFDNIIPDDKIINNLLKDVSGVPTTFFVDSDGNVIGDFIVGSKTIEEFKVEIEERLKLVK